MPEFVLDLDPTVWVDIPSEQEPSPDWVGESIAQLDPQFSGPDLASSAAVLDGIRRLPREAGTLFRLATLVGPGGQYLLLDVFESAAGVPSVEELREALPYVKEKQARQVSLGGVHDGVRWYETAAVPDERRPQSWSDGVSRDVQVSTLRYVFSVRGESDAWTLGASLSHFLPDGVVAGMDSAEQILGSVRVEE